MAVSPRSHRPLDPVDAVAECETGFRGRIGVEVDWAAFFLSAKSACVVRNVKRTIYLGELRFDRPRLHRLTAPMRRRIESKQTGEDDVGNRRRIVAGNRLAAFFGGDSASALRNKERTINLGELRIDQRG